MGGEATFGATGPANALTFHESLDLVTTTTESPTLRGLGELASSVDGVVLLPEGLKRGSELLVTHLTLGGRTGLLVVVSGRGDLQLGTDRLDSPTTPPGLVLPVGVDEGNYLFCRRSSSAPKKVAAACKMSLARCNSKFSLRRRLSSSRSSVVRPALVPASI